MPNKLFAQSIRLRDKSIKTYILMFYVIFLFIMS
jgi:hypothetical protein